MMQKMPDSTDDHSMKGKIDTQIQHKNEHLQGSLAIFWHANNFATAHEVATKA